MGQYRDRARGRKMTPSTKVDRSGTDGVMERTENENRGGGTRGGGGHQAVADQRAWWSRATAAGADRGDADRSSGPSGAHRHGRTRGGRGRGGGSASTWSWSSVPTRRIAPAGTWPCRASYPRSASRWRARARAWRRSAWSWSPKRPRRRAAQLARLAGARQVGAVRRAVRRDRARGPLAPAAARTSLPALAALVAPGTPYVGHARPGHSAGRPIESRRAADTDTPARSADLAAAACSRALARFSQT